LTPGEIIRDFISVLNVIDQNPEMKLSELIQCANFKPILAGEDGDLDDDAAEFSLLLMNNRWLLTVQIFKNF
jgi:hypothetical protein